eukprot:m.46506 g.46506  ORF g.46506 m.46506 type:complete len:1158 (+) comp47417_c0_seq4:292-3765(+)
MLLVALLLGSLASRACAADFSISSDSSSFIINGASNPPLTLIRNMTYTFSIHSQDQPFWIKTAPSTGLSNTFVSPGLSAYGLQSGTFQFTVGPDVPNTLYYDSYYTIGLMGVITVVDPQPPAIDDSDPRTNWKVGHAVIMFLAFAVLLPIAGLLHIHGSVKISSIVLVGSVLLSIAGLVLGTLFADHQGHSYHALHTRLGIAMLAIFWGLYPIFYFAARRFAFLAALSHGFQLLIVIIGLIAIFLSLEEWPELHSVYHIMTTVWVGMLAFVLVLFFPSNRETPEAHVTRRPSAIRLKQPASSSAAESQTTTRVPRGSVLDERMFQDGRGESIAAPAPPRKQSSMFSLFRFRAARASAPSLPPVLDDPEENQEFDEVLERVAELQSAVVVASSDGEILSWSDGAQDLLGYSAAEVVGQRLDMLFAEDFRATHQVAFAARVQMQLSKKGGKKPADTTSHRGHALTKTGETVEVDVSLSSHTVKGKLRFTGVITSLETQSDSRTVRIADVVQARLQRQCVAFGAAMQATHGLQSSQSIAKQELFDILCGNLKENKLEPDEGKQKTKAGLIRDALMMEGSTDGECIEYRHLLPILNKYGLELDEAGTLRLSSQEVAEVRTRWAKFKLWLHAEAAKIIILAIYFAFNALALGLTIHEKLAQNLSLAHAIAKGGGAILDINCTLILLPMCRLTLSYLRSTIVARYIPLDSSIDFHRLTAWTLVVGVVIHIIGHLIDETTNLTEHTMKEHLFDAQSGLSGLLLVVILVIIFIGASDTIRRAGESQRASAIKKVVLRHAVFFFSHHLFIVFYAVLLIHGEGSYWNDQVWFGLVVTGTLYAGERVYREFWLKSVPLKIVRAVAMPGGVTHMLISKPAGLRCKPGQYIFLQVPLISKFEWHPFTLSSAPDDKYLSLHVRRAGDWTSDIYNYFMQHPVTNAKTTGESLHGLPEARIDGPYGTANAECIGYTHAILISAGVGATPTTSILKHIKNRMDNKTGCAKPNCTCRCDCCLFRLQKLYVVWVNRNVEGFRWFSDYLSEVQLDEARRVQAAQAKGDIYEPMVDIRVYLTSVSQRKDDLMQVLFQVGLEKAQQTLEVDLLSNLRCATKFGRPDLPALLREVEQRHPGVDVGVFYCGSPALGDVIRSSCITASARGVCQFDYKYEIP